ncbi:MAG: YggS family pyridoxal phosphate-dependent enzyme [Candidatus Omnitrophica bacterium]|nr:YggS family pyridoxal phosphate-dependent enzyme [Candidatus Omnitrophota bacterium]
MKILSIKENIKNILMDIPNGVELAAAAKTRDLCEVQEAIRAGVKIIGENYVQETALIRNAIREDVQWHFIGHLQKNKVKKAVEIFDVIETIDGIDIAEEVNKRCIAINKCISVFIEINSGKEKQKFGVFPSEAKVLIQKVARLSNVRVRGLMTMGPYSGDPEDSRPYFSETKKIFDQLAADPIEGVQMKYLSMGMTQAYRIAIEEGANIVRIGTKIFGERE